LRETGIKPNSKWISGRGENRRSLHYALRAADYPAAVKIRTI
jgi:hypothetical protein